MNEKSEVLTALDDEEERELIGAIESNSYEPGESQMTPELLQTLREAARNPVAAPQHQSLNPHPTYRSCPRESQGA